MSKKIDKYERLEQLGKGTYGMVYKARDKATGQIFAIKKIGLQSQQGIPSTALKEIGILRQLNHINIVGLHEIIHHDRNLNLVLEFVQFDLKKYMSVNKGLDEIGMKGLLYQLLKGVEFCHRNKALHRDLKPQNLLISSDGVLKLADFGLARSVGIPVKDYAHEVVTLWYRPPDVLMGSQKYTSSIDIWSVGCIFAELTNQKPLFAGSNQEDQLQKIFMLLGSPDPAVWPQLQTYPLYKKAAMCYEPQPFNKFVPKLEQAGIDLIVRMLRCNPVQRISAAQALKHHYFANVSKQVLSLYEKK